MQPGWPNLRGMVRVLASVLLAAVAISAPAAAQKAAAKELVIVPMHIPVHVDGDLAEWTGFVPQLVIDRADQVLHAAEAQWRGPDDLSARLSVAYDPNHLYLAGVVHDDHVQVGSGAPQWDRCDCLQVCLDLRSPDRESPAPGARLRVCLMPR